MHSSKFLFAVSAVLYGAAALNVYRIKADVTAVSGPNNHEDFRFNALRSVNVFDKFQATCPGPNVSICRESCVCDGNTISCSLKNDQFDFCVKTCPRKPPQKGPKLPPKKDPKEQAGDEDAQENLQVPEEEFDAEEAVAEVEAEIEDLVEEIIERTNSQSPLTMARNIVCPAKMDKGLVGCAKVCYACDTDTLLPGPSWTGGDSGNKVYCKGVDRTNFDTAFFSTVGPRCTCQ